MRRGLQFALLAGILLVALLLRIQGHDWDGYSHFHPDERYISWVATTIEWPDSFSEAADPLKSSFNPFRWPERKGDSGIVVPLGEPRAFAYGHVPLYLGVAFTNLAERIGTSIRDYVPESWHLLRLTFNLEGLNRYDHVTVVGRLLAALLDSGTVLLTFLLGRRLYGPLAGAIAATLGALALINVQLAHFFAVDPFLTFFVALAIYLSVVAADRQAKMGRRRWALALAAVATGLAVGSKFSAVVLLLPLLVASIYMARDRSRKWLAQLIVAAAIATVTFALTNPYALIDWSCADGGRVAVLLGMEFKWPFDASCYLSNVGKQGAMVRGAWDVPYTRQYDGTWPVLFQLENLFKWSLGPLLTTAVVAGLAWSGARGAGSFLSAWQAAFRGSYRRRTKKGDSPFAPGELVMLAWVVPYLIFTLVLQVKFIRYLQPAMPMLLVFASGLLLLIRPKVVRIVAVALLLLTSVTMALGYVTIYRQQHPWTAASYWIYDNVDRGATLVSEAWDDPLPRRVDLLGQSLSPTSYFLDEVNWLSATGANDSREKIERNSQQLSTADYVIISSNRNYGVVARLEERYPLSSGYYQQLFDGNLGYRVAYVGGRFPSIFGVKFVPDYFDWPELQPPATVSGFLQRQPSFNLGRLDESLTVYDQPLVIIFENVEQLSGAEIAARISGQLPG